MSRTVLLTGAGGILGRQLIARVPKGWSLEPRTRAQLDVTDPAAVRSQLEALRPEVVIHAGAMTAVDACEAEVLRAFAVNGEGTRHVAEASAAVGAGMVYVSTDYVFDGQASTPYVESDPVRPLSVYGRSKWWGEQAVREHGPAKSWILRTQWVYGPGGPNFVDTMLRVAREGKPLRVVDDQVGCPTSTFDLAEGIWQVLGRETPAGTYHLSSSGEVSWYGFAREIFRLAGLSPALEACGTEDFPRPAPRPSYGVLRNLHLELTVGDPMPAWEEGLRRAMEAGS